MSKNQLRQQRKALISAILRMGAAELDEATIFLYNIP